MLKMLLAAAVLSSPFPLAAEMPEVVETRTKITCTANSKYVVIDKDGKETKYEEKGIKTETIRLSYTDGKVEYRNSQYKMIDPDGRISTKGFSILKVLTTTDGETTTEVIEAKSVSFQTTRGLWANKNSKFRELQEVSKTVTKGSGNQKAIETSFERDGVTQTRKATEYHFEVSPKEKTIYTMEETPYLYKTADYTVRIDEDDQSCTYEILD